MRGLGESDQRTGVFLGKVFLRIRIRNEIFDRGKRRLSENASKTKRACAPCSQKSSYCSYLRHPNGWDGIPRFVTSIPSKSFCLSPRHIFETRVFVPVFLKPALPSPPHTSASLSPPFARTSNPPFISPVSRGHGSYAAISSCTSPTRWIAVIRSPKDKAIP